MCCSLQQYTANTGTVKNSAANPNRDGTGTLTTVISGASAGTYVKTINITAEDATSQGMLRFFIDNGSSTLLFKEVSIPAHTPSSLVATFHVKLFGGFTLTSSHTLKVANETGDLMCISADAINWSNCSCPT